MAIAESPTFGMRVPSPKDRPLEVFLPLSLMAGVVLMVLSGFCVVLGRCPNTIILRLVKGTITKVWYRFLQTKHRILEAKIALAFGARVWLVAVALFLLAAAPYSNLPFGAKVYLVVVALLLLAAILYSNLP